MSWTLDPEQARWFAQYRSDRGGQQGVVYEATVPPSAVLGLIQSPDSRQEREVIVNPNMLRGRTRIVEQVAAES